MNATKFGNPASISLTDIFGKPIPKYQAELLISFTSFLEDFHYELLLGKHVTNNEDAFDFEIDVEYLTRKKDLPALESRPYEIRLSSWRESLPPDDILFVKVKDFFINYPLGDINVLDS